MYGYQRTMDGGLMKIFFAHKACIVGNFWSTMARRNQTFSLICLQLCGFQCSEQWFYWRWEDCSNQAEIIVNVCKSTYCSSRSFTFRNTLVILLFSLNYWQKILKLLIKKQLKNFSTKCHSSFHSTYGLRRMELFFTFAVLHLSLHQGLYKH